jgi:hypothetical protein
MPSPFPEGTSQVPVHVEVGSPLAEVFLIDHDFSLIDRSLGDLDTRVEPGVYKVKATLGEATTERLVVLPSDEPIDLSRELAVPAPAPLYGTAKAHEFHAQAAIDSAPVSRAVGSGAKILLVTRRFSARKEEDGARAEVPISGLLLLRPDGKTVADLSGSAGFDPVKGGTIGVDPGTYYLRWSDAAGLAAEEAIQALENSQTQVFLLEEADRTTGVASHNVSVLMSRTDFQSDEHAMRRVEEARSALADERKVASRDISEALFAKFENPMLGLYGAHLMLLSKESVEEVEEERSLRKRSEDRLPAPVDFDQNLFDTAIDNLRDLLGDDNPDVIALSAKASKPCIDGGTVVETPPMLWRSWLLLIEASNDFPGLVPVALWRRVRRVLTLRPFFIWSPVEGADEAGKEWERDLARTLKGVTDDEDLRRFTKQLLAPRAAIEELVGGHADAGA